MFSDVWKMGIIHYCKIDKIICTDLLGLKKQELVENGAPDPSRPQSRFSSGYLTSATPMRLLCVIGTLSQRQSETLPQGAI